MVLEEELTMVLHNVFPLTSSTSPKSHIPLLQIASPTGDQEFKSLILGALLIQFTVPWDLRHKSRLHCSICEVSLLFQRMSEAAHTSCNVLFFRASNVVQTHMSWALQGPQSSHACLLPARCRIRINGLENVHSFYSPDC